MTTSEVGDLFTRTLLGDYESKEAWAAVSALRMDGNREIFERAAAWCESGEALKRARAVDILCQLRVKESAWIPGDIYVEPAWLYCKESYSLIARMLETEQHLRVIESAIHALGHLYDRRAVPVILRYLNHPDENIRFAVSCGLGHFPNEGPSVKGLLTLMSDADDEVRDWAVFGLSQGDADSPEIREALLRCLGDANEDVREEAADGLAKRHDQRVLPKLLEMLDHHVLNPRVAEAADSLLGLVSRPSEWGTNEYKAALSAKFPFDFKDQPTGTLPCGS